MIAAQIPSSQAVRATEHIGSGPEAVLIAVERAGVSFVAMVDKARRLELAERDSERIKCRSAEKTATCRPY